MRKLIFLLLLPFFCFSQIPSYYNGIDFNQNGRDLESDLGQLIVATHTNPLPYTSSQPDTWDAVKQTDLVPGDTENVLLFYGFNDSDGDMETDRTRDKDLSCHATPCTGLWNREHVYARSIATPSLTTDYPGSGTDAHNLRACDGDMNGTRSNRLFQDDVAGGVSHITGSGQWYPGDEWRGDVARILMYMYLRYPNQCPANDIGTGANTNHADMPDVFLKWKVDDPVSDYELQRNPVLESMQGNRNPFIDNPYLATKIWGGDNAEDTWGLLSTYNFNLTIVKIYPIPVQEKLFSTNISNEDVDIAVYNVTGQEVRLPIKSNYLDVENLSNGVYFLRITDHENVSTFKFIKN